MRGPLVAAALLLPVAAQASPCEGPVCNFATLAPYFARLAQARAGRDGTPVHILQIGDSHTAGDVMTAALRALLQARAGDGGRGVLPPGHPYGGYLTHGITASMSAGWNVAASFGSGADKAPGDPPPPLGLSGYALTSTLPGASMTLTLDPGHDFDRFVLCAIAGPASGSLLVRMSDGSEHRVDLHAATARPHCATIRPIAPQAMVTVVAPDAPVTLTSWATFRDEGGVALSNLGVVGSQLAHFARGDEPVLREELRAYAPDLIVLAFGTNEGFVSRFDAAAYEATLRHQLARLHRLAPGVPLLLLGPPDALSRNPALSGNAAGGLITCADPAGGAPLFAPPALAAVRAIQRAVAGELGIAWWDWQARMGGPCSAAAWAAATPPLMRADHVHLRDAGGAIIARRLLDDLDHAAKGR